jgi:nucleotide-binding universal stress UspA family protein
MYSKVIAGYFGTDLSQDALALGTVLARATGARLLVVSVVGGEYPYAPGAEDRQRDQQAHAETVLAEAVAGIEGVEVETRAVIARSPAQGLHDLAAAEAADVLVLGSSHRGAIGRVLAGSVAERLLHGSPCAVAVAPSGYRERGDDLRVVAVGFNGSPESRIALAQAAGIAASAHAALRVFAVHEPNLFFGPAEVPARGDHGEILRGERERLEQELQEALAELPGELRTQGAVVPGSAPEVLTAEAEKGVDLLVVGSRGYGPLRRVLLGGTSARLMRDSPCPVLALPRGAGPNDAPADSAAAGAGS